MKEMKVKKLLVLRRIESCLECNFCLTATFEDNKSMFFCKINPEIIHPNNFIPDDCPLEDWKE